MNGVYKFIVRSWQGIVLLLPRRFTLLCCDHRDASLMLHSACGFLFTNTFCMHAKHRLPCCQITSMFHAWLHHLSFDLSLIFVDIGHLLITMLHSKASPSFYFSLSPELITGDINLVIGLGSYHGYDIIVLSLYYCCAPNLCMLVIVSLSKSWNSCHFLDQNYWLCICSLYAAMWPHFFMANLLFFSAVVNTHVDLFPPLSIDHSCSCKLLSLSCASPWTLQCFSSWLSSCSLITF